LERRLLEKQKLEGIGLLAGGVAHDFNNLLVGILGNASLAQEMVPPTSDVGQILDAIVKTSERAAHLTRQMLAYSGRGQFVIEPVNLSDLVRDMTSLLNPSIPSNVSVHFDLARHLLPVLADSGQLQQIVMNLVINAAEAIGERPGSISVRTRMRRVDEQFIRAELGHFEIEPATYVSLEVSDSGDGMDQATVARIFEPFFTTKFTGRGLGLAAVSGIVRGHKGAIRVTTAPGHGTTFLILLPASAESPIEAAKDTPAKELKGTGTVLIVDDEAVVLRTAQNALERHGYTTLTAESGPAGIDLFRREKDLISLVVLDLSMPGMTGQQALSHLRAINPHVPVLVSSGYSEIEVRRVFEGERLAGFIQKPYTASRLVEKVKAALTHS
jgi:CheY-like chemotaxis protein